MSGRLSGKKIFVTGAAQGIGLAIAKEFSWQDASPLFLIDRMQRSWPEQAERLKVA